MAEDEYTFDESDSETSKVLLERPTAAASVSSRRRSLSPSVYSDGSANHWSDDDSANQVRGADECKVGWMDGWMDGYLDAWMHGWMDG